MQNILSIKVPAKRNSSKLMTQWNCIRLGKRNLHGILDGVNSMVCRHELINCNLFVLIFLVCVNMLRNQYDHIMNIKSDEMKNKLCDLRVKRIQSSKKRRISVRR